jgi:hypothetical protein
MNFPGFALNYFMLATPLLVAYGLAVRAARFNPKLLSMVWTWANLAVVVWLVYRGVTVGGLSLARSGLYAAGAMVVVLVPLFASVLLFAGRREARTGPERTGGPDRGEPDVGEEE